MKTLTRFTALLLAFALCFMLVSCGEEEDVHEQVGNYLEKRYPGKEFTIIDYDKRSETSGRYEINARSVEDGIEFKLYMYSINVTDSYSVERANKLMKALVEAEFDEDLKKSFKYVQCYNIYSDRATNYRFREVDYIKDYTLADIKDIYEIKISESVKEAEIGGVIYDFMYSLCDEEAEGCDIASAEFVFKIGRLTYRFTTSSKAVLELGRDGTIFYVLDNLSKSNNPFKDVEFEYFSPEEIEEDDDRKNGFDFSVFSRDK